MKFSISRRMAAITGLNIRVENHGKEKKKAVDVSIAFTGDAKLLDQLIPIQEDNDNCASEFFFTEDGRLRAPTLNPIPINRHPEGLTVTFHDRKENPIVLGSAAVKGMQIEFNEGSSIKVTCKVQGLPDKGYIERLKDILGGSSEVSMEADQEDLFSLPAQEDKKEDKPQKDLLEDQSRARGGKGRNEGLRNTEVRTPAERLADDVGKGEDDKDEPRVEVTGARRAPAKKKSAPKKKTRGKRLGA